MADKNTTGAVHLASIDLDISGFHKKIEEIKAQIDDVSKYVNDTKFQFGGSDNNGTNNNGSIGQSISQDFEKATKSVQDFGDTTKSIFANIKEGNVDWLRGIGIDENNLISAQNKIRELAKEIEDASSVQITAKEGNLFQAIVKYSDDAGNSMREVIDLTKELNEAQRKVSITDDFEKRNKLIERQQKLLEKEIKNQEDAAWKEYEAFQKAEERKNAEIAKGVAQRNAEREKEELAAEKLTQSEEAALEKSEKNYQNSIKSLESLSSSYSKLSEQVKQSDIYSSQKDYFISNIEKAKISIEELKSDLSKGFFDESAAKKAEDGIKKFSSALEKAKSEFVLFKKETKEFSSISNNIQKVTNELNKIKDSTISNRVKVEAIELRSAYENLYKRIREGNISLEDAKSAFDHLGQSLEEVKIHAQNASGGISDMLLRFADKAKWAIAFQAVNLIQSALGQVVTTMKDTEDAVVELQRVLENPPETKTISDALYDIGYRYGQSFQNVKETAVLFAQTGQDWEEVLSSVEATMLGLNTAELDVTNATNGLIAVMSQFNIDASELETVIDKINITADNFPVTSEKIVVALQRAGGTAYNFGLTLEETIGLITALSEATGRSGENIGTALNSLINFSMKTESLEIFSEFLGGIDLTGKDVLEVWELLGAKIDDSREALANMMAGSKEFSDLFTEEIAEAIGLTDEYNQAVANSQDVYSAVGTYRQNYFIALLNNIDTAIAAMENMTGAEGYSIAENEKAMETLSKQWEQLVISAQQLAVQLGEMGILEFAKDLVDVATTALKVTKNLGGLRTIIIGLTTAIFEVKKQKFRVHIADINKDASLATSTFGKFRNAISAYRAAVETGATTTQAFNLAINALKISLGDILSIFAVVSTIFSAIAGAINEATEAARKQREEFIETGESAQEQADSIYKAYNKIEEAQNSENVEEYIDAQKELLKVLGYSDSDISILVERYGSLDTAVKTLTNDTYDLIKSQTILGAKAAEEALKDIGAQGYDVLSGPGGKDSVDTKYINKIVEESKDNFSSLLNALNRVPKSADEAKKSLKVLTDTQKEMNKTFTSSELRDSALYEAVSKQIEVLKPAVKLVEEYNEKLKLMEESDTWEEYYEKLKAAEEKASEVINNSSNAMDNAKISAEALEEDLEALSEAFDDISGRVDSFQSAYSTLLDVVDEYNETHIMTADMLQSLLELEPEYIEMLNVQADSLSLNENAVNSLINVNDNYLNQLVALKVAKEAEALATELATAMEQGKTVADLQAANAAGVLTTELQRAIQAELDGTATTGQLDAALRNLAQSFGLSGDYADYFVSKLANLTNTYSSLMGKVNKGTIGTYYTPKITTPKKTKNPALEAEKEELQKEVDALKKQKESINEQYKDIEDNLKKQKELSDDYYDGILDNLKEQKEESDKYYDGLIDNLKRVQEENDRINAQLDYYADRQKILRNIEQAQARSGIEWREKEAQYQQELIDLDEDWRRKQEDWALEDQISELERMKELAQEILEAQIKEMEDLKDAARDLIDEQIESYKKLKEDAIKGIEEQIDKLQESIQALSKAISKSTSSGISSGISSGVSAGVSSAKTAIEELSKEPIEMKLDVDELVKNVKNVGNELEKSFKKPFEEVSKILPPTVKEVGDSYGKIGNNIKNSFINPFLKGMSLINNSISNDTVKSAQSSANKMRQVYETNFINPIRQQIASMSSGIGTGLSSSVLNVKSKAQQIVQNANTINMNNSINNVQSAQAAVDRAFSNLGNSIKRR